MLLYTAEMSCPPQVTYMEFTVTTMNVVRRYGLLLTAFVVSALASSGDRSAEFRYCLSHCNLKNCQLVRPVLSLPLIFTGWTCLDDCKYICMHQTTDGEIYRGSHMQQYYGKWPFWRFAGMQEPASVAFSLLNLLAHVRGAQRILRQVPSRHPMRSYYLTWSAISCAAWVFSSVFHTRGQ
jgi:post-GPI attachment to proteins factor 3